MLTHADIDAAERFTDLVSDLAVFDDGELTERFRELELAQRRAAAEMAAIAGEVDRRGAFRSDGHRALSGWLRAHGNYAQGTVTRTQRLARLFADCPEVGEELLAGHVGVDQAAELGRVRANPRCGDQLPGAVGVLLDHARRFDHGDFITCVQRWETSADLDGAHRDRGDAVQARRATVVAGAGGVDVSATGGTALQAAEMAAIFEAFVEAEFQQDLTERRRRCGDDTTGVGFARSDPQRRFDAWLVMMRTANNSPGPNTPAVATVDVVSDLYTFETAMACHDLADEPRDLPKPDPITARCETSTGVALLPDDVVFAALGGWIRRVLIDSAGVITDLGHRSRCFTGAAAQAARLLATTCEQDGCIVPEAWSQIDHLAEWGRDGGATDQDNAGIRCGHHNRHKHRSGFRTRRDWRGKLHTQRPDGTWITPVGCDPPTEYDFRSDNEIADAICTQLEARWNL